jgi:hypothetical protein
MKNKLNQAVQAQKKKANASTVSRFTIALYQKAYKNTNLGNLVDFGLPAGTN